MTWFPPTPEPGFAPAKLALTLSLFCLQTSEVYMTWFPPTPEPGFAPTKLALTLSLFCLHISEVYMTWFPPTPGGLPLHFPLFTSSVSA